MLSYCTTSTVDARGASSEVIWSQVNNPSTGDDRATGVVVDSSGLYVVGSDDSPGNPQWRIEKRRLTDGELLWSAR